MPNFADLATGTVKIAPQPAQTGTEITLQEGEGELFPESDFYVTAQRDSVIANRFTAEILYVISRTGDVLTVVRAQRDTTAKDIVNGWRITLSLYKNDIELFNIDKTYRQDFTSSIEVIVNHNLYKHPAVSVLNSAYDQVVGDVEYIDLNTLVVRFTNPFSGTVICN